MTKVSKPPYMLIFSTFAKMLRRCAASSPRCSPCSSSYNYLLLLLKRREREREDAHPTVAFARAREGQDSAAKGLVGSVPLWPGVYIVNASMLIWWPLARLVDET